MSSAPGGLQEVMAASRPGQCGLPVWQSGRAVAGLVVMSANGRARNDCEIMEFGHGNLME